MELEMRHCKECGKLFKPKSERSQYCDAIHYRPCPVCGKLVEAKYLSDPARCCSKECQKALRDKTVHATSPTAIATKLSSKKKTPEEKKINFDELEDVEILKELKKRYYIGTYSQKSLFGFLTDNEYALEITKDPAEPYSPYKITAVYNITDRKQVNHQITLTSPHSVERYFNVAI